jgi:ribosomal protein S18 acetylase RimI-like enzyme
MTTVTVRPYRDDDFAAIAAVHDAARPDELRDGGVDAAAFLSLEATYENEGLFDDKVWVAELDGKVAGFISANAEEINWLYVDPAHYRKGIGSALLRTALAEAGDRVEIGVLAGNTPAIEAYRKAGFVIVETRTGKLVGNEAFAATGHVMELRRGAAADS